MLRNRALALLFLLFLSGCLGGGKPQAADPVVAAPARPTVELEETAAPAAFDAETGAISGIVLDDIGLPLPGARVADGERQTFSAQDGSFTFSFIPPHRHTLYAEAEGFFPETVTVMVKLGALIDGVTFILSPRTATVPHRVDFAPQAGFLSCGYAFEIGAGKDFCKIAFTGDHDVFAFPVADRGVVTGFVAELQWSPSVNPQFSRILGLKASDAYQWPAEGRATLATNGEQSFRSWSVRGTSPLTYEMRATNDTGLMWLRGGPGFINVTATSITATPMEFAGDPTGSGPILVFQQPLTVYASAFMYGARPPEGFRASA